MFKSNGNLASRYLDIKISINLKIKMYVGYISRYLGWNILRYTEQRKIKVARITAIKLFKETKIIKQYKRE